MSSEPNGTTPASVTSTSLIGAVMAAFTQLAVIAGELQYRLVMYSSLMAAEFPQGAGQALASMSARFGAIQRDLEAMYRQLEGSQSLSCDEIQALRRLWMPCREMASCQTSLMVLMRGEFPRELESQLRAFLGHIVPNRLVVPKSPFAQELMGAGEAALHGAATDTTILDNAIRLTPAIVEIRDEFFRLASSLDEFMVRRGQALSGV